MMVDFKYPLRFKGSITGVVVEFTSMQEGTVVVGNGNYLMGAHKIRWVRWDNAEIWLPVITTKHKLHEAGKLMVRNTR